MKILHLTQNFYPVTGGIETFVYESSRRLIEKGYKVYVIASDKLPDTNKKLPEHEVINGIEVFRMPFHRIFRYNISFKVLPLISNLDCDIIHIHGLGFFSDLIPLLRLIKKSKIFLSTHGGIFHTKYAIFLKNIYFNTIARFTLKFVDKIIAHSLEDKKLFSQICTTDRISLIYYGINWEELRRTKRKSDGKTLIYVGRLSKNKRLDRMLHVLFYLKKRIPNIKLLFLGSDWGEKKKLINLAKSLNILKNVKFLGSIPHEKIGKYLSEADIFLLSSEYEGFGISVIEAMASGLPVVVNDIPTMREIIANGENGFIVEFKDYKKVSELIEKLLMNKTLLIKIGEKAKLSTRVYDWKNVVTKLEEIYSSSEFCQSA
jgi:alpha-1,3-mannosyltransferase